MEGTTAVPDVEDVMDALHAEAAVVAGRLNRAHADLVALAIRLVEDQLWAGGGIRSPEHWLILRAGLSPARARDVLRLARRRHEVAPAIDLLGRGRLSLDQASEVARRVPASHAVSVTEFARDATVPQLRRVLARYPFDPDPDPVDRDEGDAAEATAGDPAEATAGDGAGGGPVGAAGHAPAEPGAPGAPRRVFAGPPELIVRDRAPASLSMGFDGGRFRLVYDAPADVGALVEAGSGRPRTRCSPPGRPAPPSATR